MESKKNNFWLIAGFISLVCMLCVVAGAIWSFTAPDAAPAEMTTTPEQVPAFEMDPKAISTPIPEGRVSSGGTAQKVEPSATPTASQFPVAENTRESEMIPTVTPTWDISNWVVPNGSKYDQGYPGYLPAYALDNAVASDKVGLRCDKPNGTNIEEWAQPLEVDNFAEWCDHLGYSTVFIIEPGDTFDLTFNYKTNQSDGQAYSAYLNATSLVQFIDDAWRAEYTAAGLSLTGPDNGPMIAVSYDSSEVCQAQSVQIVPDADIHVVYTCPDGGISCELRVGQYGKVYNLKTGELAPAEIQLQGGNDLAPGCMAPEFDFESPAAWIASLK